MKAIHLFYLFFLLVFLFSCSDKGLGGAGIAKKNCYRKYTTKVVNNDQEIKMDCTTRVKTVYSGKYKYNNPVFNPNDKNEIIYIRSAVKDGVLGQPGLWVFNFCTGKTKELASVVSNAADWSEKDWIIYRGSGGALKKIKSNGDSLTTLPDIRGATLPPKWNDKGNLFAIRVVNKRKENQILVATENGVGVAVFNDFVLRNWDWGGTQICYVEVKDGEQVIKMFNFETRTSHPIETVSNYSTSDSLFLNTIYFKEKEQIFWNQKKKICFTDLKNKKRTTILTGAGNRKYHQISLSADGKTIVANRVDAMKMNDCQMEERWNLVLIDVETGTERLIKLPE